MDPKLKCKIGLGSAQWGLKYGISNKNGQSEEKEIEKIISYSEKENINIIDTASNYGNAEKTIGKYPNHKFKIITKTPHFKNKYLTKSDGKLLISTFNQSLKNLNRKNIYALLIHNYNDLHKNGSENIIESLYELKNKKLVEKIGISIYSNCDIEKIFSKMSPDLVQLPLNIFDQRMLNNDRLNYLKSKGIEIHVRSIFLQGLLLMEDIPKYFLTWQDKLNQWKEFCLYNQKSKMEIALNFVNNLENVDSLILGVETLNQLKEIKNALDQTFKFNLKNFACEDERLINPINWKIKN